LEAHRGHRLWEQLVHFVSLEWLVGEVCHESQPFLVGKELCRRGEQIVREFF
jgi:hypothetical protein